MQGIQRAGFVTIAPAPADPIGRIRHSVCRYAEMVHVQRHDDPEEGKHQEAPSESVPY